MIKIAFIMIIFLLSFFCFSNFLYSQIQQWWVVQYTATTGTAKYLAVDKNQNIYVAGTCVYWGVTGYDAALVKYNTNGVQQWARTYNDTINGDDYTRSIATDNLNNIYLCGTSILYNRETFIIKYNSAGAQIWIARRTNFGANKIRTDKENNLIVAGSSLDSLQHSCISVIKYNPDGVLLWQSKFFRSESDGDGTMDVVIDKNDDIILTGRTWNPWTNQGWDYTTIKYYKNGDTAWVRYYDAKAFYAEVFAISVDSNNNSYVTGQSYEQNHGLWKIATVKYNPYGVQQWVAVYDTTQDQNIQGFYISVDRSENVFVGGVRDYEYVTLKYDSSGNQQWVRYYNSGMNYQNSMKAMVLDNFGNVYVTGNHRQINPDHTSFVTIKYNPAGVQQWLQTYDHQSIYANTVEAIALDSSLNVYLTGRMDGYFTTIKYSQLIGIKPISSKLPSQFYLYQNYPNPFNPLTTIKFSLPNPSKGGVQYVRLVIYDILGKEVETLIPPLGGGQEGLKPGTYEMDFDGSNLGSSVYFYRLITDGFTETKKMVLLK